jgi:vacuolar-type H+-ATPase subunit I/STV1
MFIFSTLSDELTRTFKKIGNGQINITQIEEFNNKMNDNPKNEEFKLNIVLYFLSKAESIFEEISWFRGFDLFRQQGFYVDFDNEIKSPLQCTEQDYISIKSKVNKVNESVNDIIKSVNNDTKENRDLLDSLLKRLNTDKVYASMSRFIDNVKQHKTNALDYAYDSISPFIQDFKGELNK